MCCKYLNSCRNQGLATIYYIKSLLWSISCYDQNMLQVFFWLFPGLRSRQHHMDFPPGLASPARSHWEEVRFSPEVLPPAKKIGCEEVAERPATMITWGLPIPGYMCYLNLWWNCVCICMYIYIYIFHYLYIRIYTGWWKQYEFVNGKDDIPYAIYEMEKKMKPPTRFSERLNKKMKLSDDLLLVLVALVIPNNGF